MTVIDCNQSSVIQAAILTILLRGGHYVCRFIYIWGAFLIVFFGDWTKNLFVFCCLFLFELALVFGPVLLFLIPD